MKQLVLHPFLLIAVVFFCGGSGPAVHIQTPAGGDSTSAPSFTPHCWFLRAGEIEAIVGDGEGQRVRPGIWALSSINYQFSIFKNMSSGMLGGNMRGRHPILEPIDNTSCRLRLEATEREPSRSLATFKVSTPYYFDYTLTFRDTRNHIPEGLTFRSIGWANYINSPDDLRMHFISGGRWIRFIPQVHGGPGSSIAPSYIPDGELEVWPTNFSDPSFWWNRRSEHRFDEPFFYGRLQDMVVIWVFDTPRWLRFFGSPEGGGASLIPGKTSTAWDFEWIIPQKDYRVDQDYTFRVRLILKKYVDDNDVLREVRKTQDDLGFEKAPASAVKTGG
jgi:hypothetical protein